MMSYKQFLGIKDRHCNVFVALESKDPYPFYNACRCQSCLQSGPCPFCELCPSNYVTWSKFVPLGNVISFSILMQKNKATVRAKSKTCHTHSPQT